MEVIFIQAKTIKSSKFPIESQDGFHVKKIKNTYYLIKTIIINYDTKRESK